VNLTPKLRHTAAARAIAPLDEELERSEDFSERGSFEVELRRRVAEAQRYGSVFSVMLLKIDRLERYAAEGDELSPIVIDATRRFLFAAVREMDLVARLDAGSFAVLMPAATAAEAAQAAERLRSQIAEAAPRHAGRELRLTACFGLAEFRSGDNVSSLLTRAQAALDMALESGGNRVRWHDGDGCHPPSTGDDARGKSAQR
jgi:diguanylate cyclase (GGDEF)-like protein